MWTLTLWSWTANVFVLKLDYLDLNFLIGDKVERFKWQKQFLLYFEVYFKILRTVPNVVAFYDYWKYKFWFLSWLRNLHRT